MTDSETLRAMLDERGIEHDDNDLNTEFTGVRITRWKNGGKRDVRYEEWRNGTTRLDAGNISPEQAIAATVGKRSCASCPEMNNPDSYISHIHRALEWHDEHVPIPTNPIGTCVVLQGKKPPEEVLFIRDEGGVTHYLPEETCHYDPDDAGFTWWDENDVEHYEEYSASDECWSASCDKCGHTMMVGNEGWFDGWDEITEWTEEDGSEHKGYVLKPRFKYCPNCGSRVVDK